VGLIQAMRDYKIHKALNIKELPWQKCGNDWQRSASEILMRD
jgi:hypothetical protein